TVREGAARRVRGGALGRAAPAAAARARPARPRAPLLRGRRPAAGRGLQPAGARGAARARRDLGSGRARGVRDLRPRAAAVHRLPARAYTAAFADGDAELGAAAEHAARAGVEHATVGASSDWPAALDRLLAAHGGPVGGPEVAALQLAATRARGEVDILLAGVGGEEIFG